MDISQRAERNAVPADRTVHGRIPRTVRDPLDDILDLFVDKLAARLSEPAKKRRVVKRPVALPERLITEEAAAEILSVNVKFLKAWRDSGTGPSYVMLKSYVIRYRVSDLESFLFLRTKGPMA